MDNNGYLEPREIEKDRTESKILEPLSRAAVSLEEIEESKMHRTETGKAFTSKRSLKEPMTSEGYASQQRPFENSKAAQMNVDSCIERDDVIDKDRLNSLCKWLGKKDEGLKRLCNAVCQNIKKTNPKLDSVLPTYHSANPSTSDENEIVFVAYAQETLNPEEVNDLGYTVKLRKKGKYSEEGRDVFYKEHFSNYSLSFEKSRSLKSCINKHAADLMRRHSFLSVIAPSSVRSKGYGTNDSSVKEEPCIALYVHTKSYIPLSEDPFQNEYDGIPVDVREGSFETHPRLHSANNYNNTLKIGSGIRNEVNSGTLGGFIEHPFYGLCGFTCAHVLVKDFGTLKEHGTIEWLNLKPTEKEYLEVYQPGDSSEAVGSLVLARYEEGSKDRSGVEAALFQIESRHPTSGDFAMMQENAQDDDLRFDSGKVQGFSGKGSAQVVKFGNATFKTEGKIDTPLPSTSVRTSVHNIFCGQSELLLHNQLQVISTGQPAENNVNQFANYGDSGSLVFLKGNDGKLACVGMVEGGTSYGATIVTPITSVLEAFNVSKLKSFETENLASDISRIKTDVQAIKTTLSGQDLRINETIIRTLQTYFGEQQMNLPDQL